MWERGSPPRVRGKGIGGLCERTGVRITPACAGKRLKKYREYANISIDYDAIHLTSHRSLKAYGNLPTHGDPASLLIQNIRILWIIYNQLYHQSISWQAAMYLYSDYAAQVFRSGDKQKPKISVQMQRYDIQSDHFRLHQEKMTIHLLRVFLRYILRTRLPSLPRSCCIVKDETSSSGNRILYILRTTAR